MYGVETKVLNQAVKRNIERFTGEDFMFQLTKNETDQMVSQFVIPSRRQLGGALPLVFTELALTELAETKKAMEKPRNPVGLIVHKTEH